MRFDPIHCTASLFNLQGKRRLLHCTVERIVLVKPPGWLAFNIFHVLDFGSSNYFPFLFQGSEAAGKGDFLLSSDHLIEMATKLYRTTLSQTKQKLNIEISDEYVSCLL